MIKKHVLWMCASLIIAVSSHAKVIKVLAIGNSFSEDAIEQYLYELAAEGGDSLIIGNVYKGGQSLEAHWKAAERNLPIYAYRKIIGGKLTNQKSQTLESCIEDEPWDIISLQQVSHDSGRYETYEPWLTQLITYVKQHTCNPRVKFALHRTWAYEQNSTHKGFSKYDRDQANMFWKIVEATDKAFKSHKEFRMLIPSGTAIQNARTSFIGDNFTRDGYHLHRIRGRYTAACTWLEILTGQKATGKLFKPDGMSDKEAYVAQKAAHAAVKRPNKITIINLPKKK